MPRTVEKVETLLSEDSAMRDALSTILELSDGGRREVEWGDVRDHISSGQWGRLIETGVLVAGDEGFEFDDVDAVASAIDWSGDLPGETTDAVETDVGDDDEEIEGEGWSTWDKGAAVATLGLFAGYSLPQVRNVIGSVLDFALGPLDAVLPFYVVIMILALLTGFYSTILQANLMDMEVMGKYQDRMKDIQERQKQAKERGDDEALEEIRKEQMDAMGDQLGMFKAQFRPMVWIMVLTIPVFLWMYWKILDGHVATLERQIVVPFAGESQWLQGVIGPVQLWIVWYFVCSMAFTQLIRKSLNIQTTPT